MLKGQLIATGALNLHASTSGTIAGIKSLPIAEPGALRNGAEAPHLLLEPDGEERWVERQALSSDAQRSAQQFIKRIQSFGVCGQGGAGFPTHRKL